MIDHLSYDGSTVDVHLKEISLKTTKAFTHGTITFDLKDRTAMFGKLEPVKMPEGLTLRDGETVNFRLLAPDGTLKKQTRTGELKANEKYPETLRIAGKSKTEARFSAEDGWGIEIYKYRSYFKHEGAQTDGEIPAWLKGSIDRQKKFWNRLAWLCRDARRKCSPVPSEEIAEFVKTTILPEIDAFNNSLGKSKEKLRHPAQLKVETPALDGLWKFAGQLRERMGKGRRVPEGLLEKVTGFAQQFKAEYTPYNEFNRNFLTIAENEAEALELRRFEIRPIVHAFQAAVKSRKTTERDWSKGWPAIKYPDSPDANDWGLHYYFNKAGVEAEGLENGKGVPGLTFGPPLKPSDTGHEKLQGLAAKRIFREAEISISGKERERWRFRFCLLQHRPLPENSHIKEWKLIFKDNKLWLCLVVESKKPIPVASGPTAGLEIGWRRTEEGIRFGTLYEPVKKTFRELTMDLQRSPKDPTLRTPFRIDLGPTRWEKRNMALLAPERKPDDPIPSAFKTRYALSARRDKLRNTTKILLRMRAGEKLPAWFDKAGRSGMNALKETLQEDPMCVKMIDDWQCEDEKLSKLIAMYFERTTKRISYGQEQVAHDVCHFLAEKEIHHLVVETNFLAKVASEQKNEDPEALKASQKYRQFAAVGRFVAVLKRTAPEYGIVVDTQEAVNITRICHRCNHLNKRSEKEQFICEQCGEQLKQDQNSSINLSRFGSDPELAEMALTVSRGPKTTKKDLEVGESEK